MATQDPHHPSAKAHHTPESDHAVQVLSGGLQTTHDQPLKYNVKSTRNLHPLQVPVPVHPSITHEGEGQEPSTHPPHDFPLPRLVHRLRVPVAAFMIVRLGLRLRRAVALLRGGREREYRRDRADEYAAPPFGGASSRGRPRSPTGGGAGRAPMQSYGGREGV